MPAVVQPKYMYHGESKTFRVTTTNESDDSRVDLTGCVIEFQVKPADGDPDPPTISKRYPGYDDGGAEGIVLLDQGVAATRGQFEVYIQSSDTSGLTPAVFRYDVVVVLTTGARHLVVPPSDFDIRAVVNQA